MTSVGSSFPPPFGSQLDTGLKSAWLKTTTTNNNKNQQADGSAWDLRLPFPIRLCF